MTGGAPGGESRDESRDARDGLPAAAPTAAKIELRGVTKTFRGARGETPALRDVSLSVGEGEFVVLVGPSGCGKSTLLNLVAGLDFPDAGEVRVDGRPVTAPGRDRMMMFQEAALFPWRNVLGNVLFGLELDPALSSADRAARADEHLGMVGLRDFRTSFVHELSGGMRQRVALARSLAPTPRVLLMDEPFGALDALTRDQLYQDLQRIWQAHRKTIVFVTHNVREAVCLGTRVVLFSPHPGRIREQFEIDLPRPRDINSEGLARRAAEITRALKSHLPAAPTGSAAA